MILRINLVQYSSKFGNSQQQFTFTDGGGQNSISPILQNSMKNGYDENNNYIKSDETKCATNYSFNGNGYVKTMATVNEL